MDGHDVLVQEGVDLWEGQAYYLHLTVSVCYMDGLRSEAKQL